METIKGKEFNDIHESMVTDVQKAEDMFRNKVPVGN
jgi:hypothetical protein